jgi:hypothetical protein
VRRICHMAYFCRLGSYFRGRTSENRALCEVRRIPIPRTPVNKGEMRKCLTLVNSTEQRSKTRKGEPGEGS